MANPAAHYQATSLAEQFQSVRMRTLELCQGLVEEDYVVQTMPDVSPTKWHLAHTTWFFETFILKPLVPGYQVFNEKFDYLFNSYYQTVGAMHPRPQRGWLSRPTVAEVIDYRRYVNQAMLACLAQENQTITERTVLGLHHEQQHQELLLTDIKHVLAQNPLRPALIKSMPASSDLSSSLTFIKHSAATVNIGAEEGDFCFDNELPRHAVQLAEYSLASRLITNGEYLDFIRDGGYRRSELWLADGWAHVQAEGWQAPLYWADNCESLFTLAGQQHIDASAPVCHISFYEADAFARWAGARLATEFEWEAVAQGQAIEGEFAEANFWHPQAVKSGSSVDQLFGDVWEWTQSPYLGYPGFKPLPGSLGEYNGKFMCNQWVLRGGSCVTPQSHMRASYRNFFYPQARWQFSGIRLAKNSGED